MKHSEFKRIKNETNTQGGDSPRPVVMVCLSSSPSNKRVIRTAAKAAFPSLSGTVLSGDRLPEVFAGPSPEKESGAGQGPGIISLPSSDQESGTAPLTSSGQESGTTLPFPVYSDIDGSGKAPIALFVGQTGKEANEDSLLLENILYAREKGFEIHTVIGDDVPLAIAEFAKRAGVTDLFLGYSPPSFFLQARRPINERLLNYLPTVDIHIIPDPASSAYPESIRGNKGKPSLDLKDLMSVLAVMAAATFLSFAFYHSRFSNSNIITIYILAVLIASVMTSSRIYGLLAAILYVLLFNFLFIEPRFTLLVYDVTYLVTYLVTIVAALITGTVTIRMKNIARVSAENAYQAKILLDTSNQLEMASGSSEIIRTTSRQLVHLLNRAVLFIPFSQDSDGTFIVPAAAPLVFHEGGKNDPDIISRSPGAPLIFTAGEKTIPESVFGTEAQAMRWSAENNHQAGAFTSHYPECTCRYLSVYSGENRFGLIGISMNGRPFTDFENTILLSIVHECTMALDNERMGQQQREAEILAENERLRATLLRSLSHDLRTPLTSIYGNASNLLSHDKDLLPEDREKIYSDILEDSVWLNAQFENILSMTRLESSGGLNKTIENMEDVIEESLKHISPHPRHQVVFERPDQDLYAFMDTRLIMQVLVNLLNNAIKYTPDGSTVRVRMSQKDSMVCVEVADNGPGIPDEDKPHVFELFYTGKHILGDSYRSMGIGLNLCAMVLHAHGGEITVYDNDGMPDDGAAVPGSENGLVGESCPLGENGPVSSSPAGSGDQSSPAPSHGAVFRFTLPAAEIPLPVLK